MITSWGDIGPDQYSKFTITSYPPPLAKLTDHSSRGIAGYEISQPPRHYVSIVTMFHLISGIGLLI